MSDFFDKVNLYIVSLLEEAENADWHVALDNEYSEGWATRARVLREIATELAELCDKEPA